ncbi:hypothetical protein LF887_10815 [Chryseobacterium sp. MEBOG06]|uniref:hypothetical protein n=1 Tax=Chryseobacterium sp. MEBOG06 TaxID=2879938 RepID=UPI001F3611FC|nr:hypothetical protein [Chryseobacterium sp. MEBOG06]UKB86088.1 hypothetical protein LF887_10815 [Chryseobacterium sp. MEBOG06]
MKKSTIAVILLTALLGHALKGQASIGGDVAKSYVGEINQMFPAAPTSNNLMKFEEVPVSYYTGIPDINIPLFNIPTSNSKVPVSVQLKYHPLNAKPDDKAGETGLGWSLIAGGTISRTIRGGGADEKNRTIAFSSPPKTKFGIYNHTYNPTFKVMNDEPVNMDDYKFFAGQGRYDTEYDLFQYNFMGQSGRFYIVKDAAGNYKAEKLDRNNLRITFNNNSTGEVTSFTIVDDKGIKYIFSPMENSQKSITNIKTGLTTGMSNIDANEEINDYWSSFHLTKITDQNNVALALFKYELSSLVKYEEPTTRTFRYASNINYTNTSNTVGGTLQNPDWNMPGAIESQTINNSTGTSLLTSIEIVDKGTIYLNYEKGRQDSNYIEPINLYKLKSIQSNYPGQSPTQYTEKYIFDYDYADTNYQQGTITPIVLRKMLLNKVTKISPNNQNQEYTLEYNKTTEMLSRDGWGYYKGEDPNAITNDVIKSITYPTKGKSVFEFGTNDYSHYYNGMGMEDITGSWVDLYNSFGLTGLNSFSPTAKAEFFTINSAQKVKLYLLLGNLMYSEWKLEIYKKLGNNTFSPPVFTTGLTYQLCIQVGGGFCPGSGTGQEPIYELNNETVELEPGTYYASLSGSHGPTYKPVSYVFSADTKERVFNDYAIRKGGGLRINGIKYFDTPITTGTVAKEFIYDYRNINTSSKSSGSLVFPEPIMAYGDSYSYRNKLFNADITYSAQFDVQTDSNILPVQKTQGSDVGYKYVTVKQIVRDNNDNITDNGKTVYTFRSPLEYPNQGSLALQPPVRPIPNLDYLRGQLVSEKKYNSTGQILSETQTNYSSIEIEKNDGIKLLDNFYRVSVAEYFSYNSFQELLSHVGNVSLTTPYKNFEKFGITLPTSKTETSYFYKNGIQSSVSSTSTSVYNALDYLSLSTQLFPDGTSTITNYLYATEKNNQKLITANMLGIPLETEVAQKASPSGQSKTLAKTELIYDPSTASLFPDKIIGLNIQSNTMENQIQYDRYDSKGNLEQYTLKEGTPVTIIWGYNKTLPIAKIEGARMIDIPQSAITTIVNASNIDASAGVNNDESALLAVLDTFRKTTAANTQITTYTHDPLIGIRSIIQPSGVKELYFYDTENRLKEVKQEERDASGNISYKTLKEYQYHFKN